MALLVTNPVSNPAALASAPNELRDIRPPVAIPTGWEWLGWTLGTLAIVGLGLWAWRWWQRRRTQRFATPPIPAHVRARQKLAQALELLAQPKPFCVAVSDAVRGYLEDRFTFRAPERTTEEFLHELQATTLLTADQKNNLGDFLTRCDLVKFAKYEPGEPELRDLHASAVRLVEETEPPPVAGPGEPEDANRKPQPTPA